MVFDDQPIRDFKRQEYSTWKDKAIKELRGRPYEDLKWKISEDIEVDPYYDLENKIGASPIGKGTFNDWKISEYFYCGNSKETNTEILSALAGGAEAIFLNNISSEEQLNEVLEGVHINMIDVFVFVNDYQSDWSKGILQITRNHTGDVHDNLFFGNIIKSTSFSEDVITYMISITKFLDTINPEFRSKIIEQTLVHFESSDHYLTDIIKIRSFKLLTQYLLDHYDIHQQPIIASAVSHDKSKEPFNQMIAASTRNMASGVGGIQYLINKPLGHINDGVADSERRIARNIQHLMKMESHIDVVTDPAAGSYFFESATEMLCESIWNKFLSEIKAGGLE